jgi:tetrahydromethanopterin S-methyltransferase subunit E
MSKWASRKLWISVAGIVAVALSGPLGLSTTAVAAIGAIVAAYLGGQGYVDGQTIKKS